MSRNFMELLMAQQAAGNFVCVGLDSDIAQLPDPALMRRTSPQLEFNERIIDATADFAGAYKPNLAFYKSAKGKEVLRETIAYIHEVAPAIPVIIDAKQGDIGNTNDGYVADDFDYYGADAVTVHNYMGMEAMKPFLDRTDKGVIVLCRTSNPGAGEFQDRLVFIHPEEAEDLHIPLGTQQSSPFATVPFFHIVAARVATVWNYNGNCCVVVGATAPPELAQVRSIVGDMPILIPGIGAQGGDLQLTIEAGSNSKGQGMIINNSRGIIFAYKKDEEFGVQQFELAARKAGLKMHNAVREQLGLVPA